MARLFPSNSYNGARGKKKGLAHPVEPLLSLVNLGILYKADAAKKRWVLKSHDQQTLEKN
jgi:hypothetical protein